jgi:hypothetical protein
MGGKAEENPPRFETSFVVCIFLCFCHECVYFGLRREGCAEREEGLESSGTHRIQVYFQRFIYDAPVVLQVPMARTDE